MTAVDVKVFKKYDFGTFDVFFDKVQRKKSCLGQSLPRPKTFYGIDGTFMFGFYKCYVGFFSARLIVNQLLNTSNSQKNNHRLWDFDYQSIAYVSCTNKSAQTSLKKL